MWLLGKLSSFCLTKVHQRPVLYRDECILCGSPEDFDEYLDVPNVWYILDGQNPKACEAKTILVCSPQKKHYANFDKWKGKSNTVHASVEA